MHRRTPFSALAAAALVFFTAPALAQHDHSLIQAGRDESGMLHMHTHDHMPFEVMPSVFSGIDGFATAEVAFESLSADHPAIGLFMLDEASDLRAVLIAQDHGIQLFAGPDPLEIGGEVVLGHPFFHVMPVYNIYDGNIGDEFTMTFKFTDVSGMYTESEPFELRFVAVPAPMTASTMVLLGLVSARRRR